MPVKLVAQHGLTFIGLLLLFHFNPIFTRSNVYNVEAFVGTEISVDTILPDSIVFSDCLLETDTIHHGASSNDIFILLNSLKNSGLTSRAAVEAAGYCVESFSMPPNACSDQPAGVLDVQFENLQKVFNDELLRGPVQNIETKIFIYIEVSRTLTVLERWFTASYKQQGSLITGIYTNNLHALMITAEDSLGRKKSALQFFQFIDDTPPITNCPNPLDVFLYPNKSANPIHTSGDLDSYAIKQQMNEVCKFDLPEIRRKILDTASINDWETQYGRPLLAEYAPDHPDYGQSYTAWNRNLDYYLSDLGKILDLEVRLTDQQGQQGTCTTQVQIKQGDNQYLPLRFNDGVLSNDTFPDIYGAGGYSKITNIFDQAELNVVENIEAVGASVKTISTGVMNCTGFLNGTLEDLNEVFGPDFICGGPGLEFEVEIFVYVYPGGFPTGRKVWMLGGFVRQQSFIVGIYTDEIHALVITARDSSGQSLTGIQFFEVVDQVPPVMKCEDNVELVIGNKFDGQDQDGLAHLIPSIVDGGSWDNCRPPSFKIKTGMASDSSTAWQDTLTYTCANIGETLSVSLQGTDEKGNTNTCTSTVKIVAEEIIGSPLAKACQAGINVQLREDIDSNYTATVNATDFIYLTACAPSSYPANAFSIYLNDEIQGFIRKDTPPQASIQLDCTHLEGWPSREVPISLTYKDTLGVSEQCKTYISLSRPRLNGICTSYQPTLKGAIRDINHQGISNVEVNLSEWLDTTLSTDDLGFFQLPLTRRIFTRVKVQAFKDDDHNQNISTLDLIHITRHILGRDILESPYLLIAADINNSKSITTIDLIQLRKLILGISTNFSNNLSWRFIPADYQFRNPKAPWQEFPEEIVISQRQASQRLDFIGIKIGDVINASAVEPRSNNATVLMQLKDDYLLPGEKYALTLRLPKDRVHGIQFSIDFNQASLENIIYKQIPAEHVFWNKERHQLSIASNGFINGELLTLEVMVSKPQLLSETLKLNERSISAEVYTKDLNVVPLQLQFEGISEPSTFELFQNIPNPFNIETSIPFFIPNPGLVQLKVFDNNGRVVLQRRQNFPKGKHHFDLYFKQEVPAGIYMYSVQFENQIIRKRLIIS